MVAAKKLQQSPANIEYDDYFLHDIKAVQTCFLVSNSFRDRNDLSSFLQHSADLGFSRRRLPLGWRLVSIIVSRVKVSLVVSESCVHDFGNGQRWHGSECKYVAESKDETDLKKKG